MPARLRGVIRRLVHNAGSVTYLPRGPVGRDVPIGGTYVVRRWCTDGASAERRL